MENDLAIGIKTGYYGIRIVQIEFKANAAAPIVRQIGIAIWAIRKIEEIEHPQKILVHI